MLPHSSALRLIRPNNRLLRGGKAGFDAGTCGILPKCYISSGTVTGLNGMVDLEA